MSENNPFDLSNLSEEDRQKLFENVWQPPWGNWLPRESRGGRFYIEWVKPENQPDEESYAEFLVRTLGVTPEEARQRINFADMESFHARKFIPQSRWQEPFLADEEEAKGDDDDASE